MGKRRKEMSFNEVIPSWAATSRKGISFKDDSILKDMGIEPTPTRVEGTYPVTGRPKVFCSFCQDLISPEFRATYGTINPRKTFKTELIYNSKGEVVSFDEKVIHYSEKVVACPAHSNYIGPITNKVGEIQSQGTRFPDFD